MSCEVKELCEVKEVFCFYSRPVVVSGVIILGGIGAGMYFFPAKGDTDANNNYYMRNGLIVGSTLIGGCILMKEILKKNRC